MIIQPKIEAYLDDIRRIRRDLHKMPEMGYQEVKTQAYIWDFLSQLQLDGMQKIASTGIKAVVHAQRPRKTIAFRADIDALEMQEQNPKIDFASRHPGYMHACGHDGHTAALMMLAKYISTHRDKLKDNVVFLFQPAEESVGGAARMISEGALSDPQVDEIFGFHVWPDIPEGKIGLREGPTMAQTCEFDVSIIGKSAHGASPHKGIDALVVAAEFISMIQTVVSRSVNPYDMALITVGKIEGGEMRNVIPERVKMQGTVRTFEKNVHQMVRRRIEEILIGLEKACGVSTTFKEIMHYPVLNNPSNMAEYFASIMDYQDIEVMDAIMAAEDFAFYQQQIPGLFFFVGVKNEQMENGQPLHNKTFNFDEHALLYPMQIYAKLLDIL